MSGLFREKEKRSKPMWDMMQKMSGELKEQEERIQRKRGLLEAAGVELDLSHIKRPEEMKVSEEGSEKMTMWEEMKAMEEGFNAIKEYQDRLEAAYDEAIDKLDMN